MAAWQTKTLLIISSYWDINLPDIPDSLHEVVQYAKSRNLSHMALNCHSTLFGSKDQNERGNVLEDFMAQYGMIPGNNGNENTFVRGNSGTLIDLTFGSPDAIAQIKDWRVHKQNVMDSDHRLIQMEVVFGQPQYEFSRDLSRIDWDVFRSRIRTKLEDVNLSKRFNLVQLEDTVSKLECRILEELDKLAPLKKKVVKERFKWWTDELKALWERREDIRLSGVTTPYKRTLINALTREFNKLKRYEKHKSRRVFLSE